MKRPSGFIPIPFRLAGKIFIATGAVGLVVSGILGLTDAVSVSLALLIFFAAAIPVGLYLMFVPPKEDI